MASKKTGLPPKQDAAPEPFSFGIKIKKKEGITSNANEVRLQHTTEGHNKFYHMFIGENPVSTKLSDAWTISIIFGKIGQIGNTKTIHFPFESAAQEFLRKKLKSQLKKGYYVI